MLSCSHRGHLIYPSMVYIDSKNGNGTLNFGNMFFLFVTQISGAASRGELETITAESVLLSEVIDFFFAKEIPFIAVCRWFMQGLAFRRLHDGARFRKDKCPKSGIPDDFDSKIGYLSISVIAKASGRHLIGQRRPPPDADHFCAGYTRFWLLNLQKVPYYCTHLPENDQTIRPQRPNTTLGLMPLVPTKTGKNHLRDVHD